MTELSVPEFQRSQTPSEDLKNKENPVAENILLHSSFETLPLKVLRTSYFQYELAPGDLIKGTFLFQLANQKWSAEDFSGLEGSSETPPDSANFPDPRKQKTKICQRPDWIWELGRWSSSIRKPGNLLGKGGKQINISSASSYRFSSTELFQVRKTAFMFERHLSRFLSRECYTEFSQKESWRTHSLLFSGRACSARAKWAFTRAFFWGWCWRFGICKAGFPFLEVKADLFCHIPSKPPVPCGHLPLTPARDPLTGKKMDNSEEKPAGTSDWFLHQGVLNIEIFLSC